MPPILPTVRVIAERPQLVTVGSHADFVRSMRAGEIRRLRILPPDRVQYERLGDGALVRARVSLSPDLMREVNDAIAVASIEDVSVDASSWRPGHVLSWALLTLMALRIPL